MSRILNFTWRKKVEVVKLMLLSELLGNDTRRRNSENSFGMFFVSSNAAELEDWLLSATIKESSLLDRLVISFSETLNKSRVGY